MTKFYLIRHGNSMAGETIPGRKPGIPLSDDGKRQIRVLAEKLHPLSVDRIFTSPLERTIESARIISEQVNKDLVVLNELIEVDFGEWTGKSFPELQNDPRWRLWHSFRTGTFIPGGESAIEVQCRAVKKLEELRESYADQNIVIVTHGDVIRSLVCYYSGISIENMLKIRIDTASLTVLKIDDHWAELACINMLESIPV